MKTELATVEFVPGFEGIGTPVTTDDGYRRGGWLYQCDGMPSLRGCGNEIVVTRRYVRVGTKPSGWFVTYAQSEDGSEDRDFVLTFCPSCAKVVWGQK